jgi:nucleoid DNA-binding protein
MSIKYRFASIRHPVTGVMEKRVVAVRRTPLGPRQLAQRIAQRTTVHEGEAALVLLLAGEVIAQAIREGDSVQLPGLGRLLLMLRSGIVDDSFNAQTGLRASVILRTEPELKSSLKSLHYEAAA